MDFWARLKQLLVPDEPERPPLVATADTPEVLAEVERTRRMVEQARRRQMERVAAQERRLREVEMRLERAAHLGVQADIYGRSEEEEGR